MINYNYSFICTYKELNQDYYSNLCYQIQLLQVFNMDKYDEYILQKNIESVYIFLRDNNYIKEIFKLLQEKLPNLSILNYVSNNLENLLYLQILFSYDYFDIFHKEFIEYNKNKNYNFEELKSFILRDTNN